MKSSSSPWENLVYEKGIVSSPKSQKEDLEDKVYSKGSYVLLRDVGTIAYKLNNDDYFKSKNPPFFHISKEKIRSVISRKKLLYYTTRL